jgi:predicted ester cyclase
MEIIMQNEQTLRTNKDIVQRFNREVLERGDERAFHELVAPGFVDNTAPPGAPTGPEGLLYAINQILRPAFPDLVVEIHDQIAEGDKVTTRKTLHGTHRGLLFGIPATDRRVAIDVIDIVRLENGRYVEHWGINTLSSVLASLQQAT